MPRRIGPLATLLLLPFLEACFLDPTCERSCEGSVIDSCDWKCTGQKIDVPECEREYTRVDCAEQLGPSGGPMTCKLVSVGSESSEPTCLDATMSCDPAAHPSAWCLDGGTLAECIGTPTEGYYQRNTPCQPKQCVSTQTAARCEP
jgi:hypothetical protein